MSTIDELLHAIRAQMAPQVEARLREELALKDRDWLVEQLIRLSLGPELAGLRDQVQTDLRLAEDRAGRIDRLRMLGLDSGALNGFIAAYGGRDQNRLIEGGFLKPGHPAKGTEMVAVEHRTPEGEKLLEHAKDILFGLLYGDETTGTVFNRCEREILTITLPRGKAHSLAYLKATTELQAFGTWRDPGSVSHDSRADNVLVQVEFGETADEHIGSGLVVALGLINNLEINEQILYAQMVNVEQSTLTI
jgi:hypothetical protein